MHHRNAFSSDSELEHLLASIHANQRQSRAEESSLPDLAQGAKPDTSTTDGEKQAHHDK